MPAEADAFRGRTGTHAHFGAHAGSRNLPAAGQLSRLVIIGLSASFVQRRFGRVRVRARRSEIRYPIGADRPLVAIPPLQSTPPGALARIPRRANPWRQALLKG